MDDLLKLARENPGEAIVRSTHHHHEVRRTAIEAALQAAGGFELRAAEILGVPRSTLKAWLSRFYPDLEERAAQLRAAGGYKGGNPTFGKPEGE